MTVVDIDALAKPITQLLESFGHGQLPQAGNPADALKLASGSLETALGMGAQGIQALSGVWQGAASLAAVDKATASNKSAAKLSDRGKDMSKVTAAAAADVNAGMLELQGILQSFVAKAVSMGPLLGSPPGLAAIMASAVQHLGQALVVVSKTRAKLSTHTAAMSEFIPPEQVPSPAGATQAAKTVASSVQQLGSPLQGLVQQASGLVTGSPESTGLSGLFSPGGPGPKAAAATAGAGADPGKGVKITLPDGSTAIAPNEKAASAVRAALGQRGVPYLWGGTSPGQGLDCSGLTQYAYRQGGVELPRLAQEQNVGTRVSPNDLQPGDLAVWDGHVAMVIGNGQMVEAGDPVQTGAIRTSNSGMAFKGFYRPTE